MFNKLFKKNAKVVSNPVVSQSMKDAILESDNNSDIINKMMIANKGTKLRVIFGLICDETDIKPKASESPSEFWGRLANEYHRRMNEAAEAEKWLMNHAIKPDDDQE